MTSLKTFPGSCQFDISTKIHHSQVKDEIVILDPRSSAYFNLNQVGSTVWKLIEELKTVEQIKSAILDKYKVGEEECDRDLQELLQELVNAKLVSVKQG